MSTSALLFFHNKTFHVSEMKKEEFSNLHRVFCTMDECKQCKVIFQLHRIHKMADLSEGQQLNINLIMHQTPEWSNDYNIQPIDISSDSPTPIQWRGGAPPDLSMYGAFLKSEVVHNNEEKTRYNVMSFSFHGIYLVVLHDLSCKHHKPPSAVRLNTHLQLSSRATAFYCNLLL